MKQIVRRREEIANRQQSRLDELRWSDALLVRVLTRLFSWLHLHTCFNRRTADLPDRLTVFQLYFTEKITK